MFDTWVKEVGNRYGIDGAADALAATLLPIIFDERQGGIAGLVSRFHQRVGGGIVSGWVGNPASGSTCAVVVEDVIGRDVLAALDRQFDLPDGTIASITAAELPALIGQLTPEGRLPIRMPRAIATWVARHDATRAAAPRRRGGASRQATWTAWGLLLGTTAVLAFGAAQRARNPVPVPKSLPSASATPSWQSVSNASPRHR